MHKNTLWFIVAILCIYFSVVFCEESAGSQELVAKDTSDLLKNDSTELTEEGRTRRHRHHLYSRWGIYALVFAYLAKVKIVVVAFFVGSAVWLGLRYLWPHKCNQGIYKEGIILDHPPSFDHHDHIPYSLGHDHAHYSDDHHHFDSSSWGNSGPSNFEPYSAYSGLSYDASDAPPDSTSPESHTFRKKRDVNGKEHNEKEQEVIEEVEDPKQDSRQMPATEEQIGDFMFSFLGLDTTACRRRFICEMEFRSKANPLTAMAFRVVGRSFFGKYTNDHNESGRATSFEECAAANSKCVFIENENTEETNEETTEEVEDTANTEEAEEIPAQEVEEVHSTDDLKVELPTEENSLESNNIEEQENSKNIKAELRRNSYRRRVRGDRHLQIE